MIQRDGERGVRHKQVNNCHLQACQAGGGWKQRHLLVVESVEDESFRPKEKV